MANCPKCGRKNCGHEFARLRAEVEQLRGCVRKQCSEWKNELVRMELLGELGGPKEAMVRGRLKECVEALLGAGQEENDG